MDKEIQTAREIWQRAIDMLNEIHERMGIDNVIKAKMERLAVDKIAEKHLQKLHDDLMSGDVLVIKPKDCPNCDNSGCYPVPPHGDPQQCQFCYETPDSRFNLESMIAEKGE